MAEINSLVTKNVDEKQALYVIKTGGNVIDDESSLHSFLKDFSSISQKKILVHGGGKIATSIGDKMGIQSKYIDGRRITGDETIDLVTMVYGGLVNKKIVARLQSLRCNAIGLSGADANVLKARKRVVKTIDYGWVGDVNPSDVDSDVLQILLNYNLVPVIASLTHDGEGHILNTNADTISTVLSIALSKWYNVKLMFCFEKNGVLRDVNDDQSLLHELNEKEYKELINTKHLFAGILPKIDNAFDAVKNGVQEVIIGNSSFLLQLIKGRSGTKIIL